MRSFEIDADIRRASTLPSFVYRDPEVFALLREKVFARSWQLVPEAAGLAEGRARPFLFLPGLLDEPLLVSSSEGVRVLSNVCTHRGNVVASEECGALRCGYHGRRFALDGRMLSMPEFHGAENFPSSRDDLPRARFERWRALGFASLDPAQELSAWLRPVEERVGWLPLDRMDLDRSRSREYLVNASWIAYCDNYLEGLHIPFVHPSLARALDYSAYSQEVFETSSLQVGIASSGDDAFTPPTSSRDHGKRVAGYYFWLWPNLMLNFYPWGVSVNVVQPLGVDKTRVVYLSWVWDPTKLGKGAGGALDAVELEDEAVVENVQRGLRSRLYDRGRYSPSREECVHLFHRLIAKTLSS